MLRCAFSGQRADKLVKNPRFQHHATKFMEALSSLCDMLPTLDPDAPHSRKLMVLGAQHATIPGFDVVYFSLFLKCLHMTWERTLKDEYTAEVRHVWSIIFEFAVERIRDGYVIFHEENGHGPAARRGQDSGDVVQPEAASSCNENGITLVAADDLHNDH